MGGIVCAIHRNNVLRFETIPTQPQKLKEFDEQMRDLINVTTIATAIGNETPHGQAVCDILKKPHWTNEDRVKLLDIVEHLEYSTPLPDPGP